VWERVLLRISGIQSHMHCKLNTNVQNNIYVHVPIYVHLVLLQTNGSTAQRGVAGRQGGRGAGRLKGWEGGLASVHCAKSVCGGDSAQSCHCAATAATAASAASAATAATATLLHCCTAATATLLPLLHCCHCYTAATATLLPLLSPLHAHLAEDTRIRASEHLRT
jgi:hypothetical protein